MICATLVRHFETNAKPSKISNLVFVVVLLEKWQEWRVASDVSVQPAEIHLPQANISSVLYSKQYRHDVPDARILK